MIDLINWYEKEIAENRYFGNIGRVQMYEETLAYLRMLQMTGVNKAILMLAQAIKAETELTVDACNWDDLCLDSVIESYEIEAAVTAMLDDLLDNTHIKGVD